MKNNFKNLILFIVLLLSVLNAFGQTTAFTYQGKLTDTGVAANGPYDLTLKLYDLASGGTQLGADVVVNDTQVTAGIFTVNLDFGAAPFTSLTANYLEISVRPGASDSLRPRRHPKERRTRDG